MPASDTTACRPGRVIRMHGLQSVIEMEDGTLVRCAVRRLLKSLMTDERSIVTTGDRVSGSATRNRRGYDRARRATARCANRASPVAVSKCWSRMSINSSL